jgi:hypothetical protein
VAYFAGGAERVWTVNPRHGVLEVYAAPDYQLRTHCPGESRPEVAGIEIDTEVLFDALPERP